MSEQEDETSLLMKGVSHGSNDMKVNGVSHGSNDVKVNIKSSEMRMQRIENEENENAKIWNIPKLFIGWLQILRDSFGAPFMTVVIIVYGVSQGYVGTVKGLATAYYWKDVQKLQPASTQAFQVKYFMHFYLMLFELMSIETLIYQKRDVMFSSSSQKILINLS
jgi:hypothetical protein